MRTIRKPVLFFVLLLASPLCALSQSYNTENIELVNYIIRMYDNSPFEGVRVVDDYDAQHLIVVIRVEADKYKSESDMYRAASVMAMSRANIFINGANISSETIIHTESLSSGLSDSMIIENIRENSSGYIRSLQHLTNFSRSGQEVLIYSVPITVDKKTVKRRKK